MEDFQFGMGRPSAVARWGFVFIAAAALIVFDPVAGFVYQMMGPGQQAAEVDPSGVPSPMLEIQVKYAIGVERILGQSVADAPFGAPTPDDYVQMAGEDQVDRVRAVVMVAEIFDADAALAEVDVVRADIPELDAGLEEDLAVVESILKGEGASEDARARLADRHGFFGELAVAQIPDDADSAAMAELLGEKAARLAVVVFSFGGLFLVAGVVGFVLLIVFAVLFGSGRWKTRLGAELRGSAAHEYNWLMAEAAAVFLWSFFAYKLVATLVGGYVPGVVLLGGQFALALLIFWPAWRLGSLKKASVLLGWSRGQGVIAEVAVGFVTYLAGLPIVALGLVLALLLISIFGGMPSHPVTESLPSGGIVEIVLLYVLACVWAPIVEETVFRGAFYRGLRVQVPGVFGVLFASAMSSFIFAAIHPQGILFVPPLMALAMVFAFMRENRGTLIGPMFAHAMHNATIVTFALLVFGS